MSDFAQDITDQTFEKEVLEAEVPVLVDFYADWCPPCKILAPILDDVGEKNQGKAKVLKLNVDENREMTERYQIFGMPTVIVFKNGEAMERHPGAKSEQFYQDLIDKYIT